jgi:hypothetical protein
MIPLVASLLLAAAPSLADLGRSPTLDQAHALIRVRHKLATEIDAGTTIALVAVAS